jgi:hypothetical protein
VLAIVVLLVVTMGMLLVLNVVEGAVSVGCGRAVSVG